MSSSIYREKNDDDGPILKAEHYWIIFTMTTLAFEDTET